MQKQTIILPKDAFRVLESKWIWKGLKRLVSLHLTNRAWSKSSRVQESKLLATLMNLITSEEYLLLTDYLTSAGVNTDSGWLNSKRKPDVLLRILDITLNNYNAYLEDAQHSNKLLFKKLRLLNDNATQIRNSRPLIFRRK